MPDNTSILGTLVSVLPHKPGQARATRWTALLVLVGMAIFGCAELYRALAGVQRKVYTCSDHRTVVAETPGLCPTPGCAKELTPGEAPTWMSRIIFNKRILGIEILLRGAIYVSLAVFAVSSWIIYRMLHWAKAGDFMIDMEGELRKVAWPARKEFLGASVVVIVLTVFISAFLFGVDWLLSKVMVKFGIGI